jgi:hypothetical protein
MENTFDKSTCDFSGWATRNDLLCGDGRTIRRDAFKHNDGETVPIFWNHQHNDIKNVLGNALLENREEGVYAYGKFNDTEDGIAAKKAVLHGDIKSLSIYANKLKQVGMDVLHGTIRELSLVPAGANPGAFIDFIMAHGEDGEDSFIAGYDENIMIISHSDAAAEKEGEKVAEEKKDEKTSEKKDEKASEEKNEKTIKQVYNEMTEEQKAVVHAMVDMALKEKEGSTDDDNKEKNIEHSEGGNNSMKTNVFDQGTAKETNVLSHSDQEAILNKAKSSQVGSFQAALEMYADENDISLEHAASAVGGFQQTSSDSSLTIDALFPEYKDLKPGAPEFITNDQGWISVVMSKVHKSPISRIRTGQVDIRNIDTLRAKGYQKGKEKKVTGNFKLVRRTTDPQTVYVKNALHRDDIVDITDFDYVQYLYNIDRMMLNEELATAIMFGDGREDGDEAKISAEHIRPIWLDDDLYTLHVDLDVDAVKNELQGTNTGANFGTNFVRAEALVNQLLYARENYKGSGTPDLFIHPHELNVMLLARDISGHRMYASKAELASALNVNNIYTVEQMNGKTRTVGNKTKKLLAIVANLADYSLGATKGGEITHFTQFDIDFNQQKSLLETRCSGALTKVYSAIVIEETVASNTEPGGLSSETDPQG